MNDNNLQLAEEKKRRFIVTELAKLGFFDVELMADAFEAVVFGKGEVRLKKYSDWKKAIIPNPNMPIEASIVIGLLDEIDIAGIEAIWEQTKSNGPELAHTRFLESAIQFATGRGDAYVLASRIGRPRWRSIFNVLCCGGWTPHKCS